MHEGDPEGAGLQALEGEARPGPGAEADAPEAPVGSLLVLQTQDRAVKVVRLLAPVGRIPPPLQTPVERASSSD